MAIPIAALHGIHTARAIVNFRLAGQPAHPELVSAYGVVKVACLRAARGAGAWVSRDERYEAVESAAVEMSQGALTRHVVVDALQGGAGTSLNMNVNEVIANRALELLGLEHGRYDVISPMNDVNRFQSTNDTFPTALRVAAIRMLRALDRSLTSLHEAFQSKEREFAHIVKLGRTECRDAVLITLGREMGAYAEAFARDRWRVYKCEERLRVVNLGGTAIGTAIGAPRSYVFSVVDFLRELTGLGLARAENLVEATQNADIFVEVSGILKACASNMQKISGDLRFLSCGPSGGPAEIVLPAMQAGSSIMPGKVNPVIPEAAAQAAMMVVGMDASLTAAAGMGHMELNPFLPLIAECLLRSIELLDHAASMLCDRCITGLLADEERCHSLVLSSTATATALISRLGYEKVAELCEKARQGKSAIRDVCVAECLLSEQEIDALISPEAVCSLGYKEIK